MKNIALASSGGGFRAAAYSLGTLSYLDELKTRDGDRFLLENVKFIGSTSGGSLSNIAYSAGVFRGDKFPATCKKTAEQARIMPTTLWFDRFQKEADKLKMIVATGQFTTCYNLLKFYTKQTSLTEDQTALMDRLKTDWHAFKLDPFRLYNKLN